MIAMTTIIVTSRQVRRFLIGAFAVIVSLFALGVGLAMWVTGG